MNIHAKIDPLWIIIYSKTSATQKDKTKNLMTNGSLMKVESIAECLWTILQYF